jgi:formylglycine-generating enzyme required for sulfatase activity
MTSTQSVSTIVSLLALLASAEGDAASNDAAPVSVPTVAVTNAGNKPDPVTLAGAVDHDFRIAQYEITIGQYTAFLNAVAQVDPHGLYNPKMATDLQVAGIARTGGSGKFKYSVIPPSGPVQISAATPDQRPMTYVSWFDSARFANWMSNKQPSGRQTRTTTENGAYNLLSTTAKRGLAVPKNTVNPNTGSPPIYFLPTENEWYKAAYYNPALNNNAGGYTLLFDQQQHCAHKYTRELGKCRKPHLSRQICHHAANQSGQSAKLFNGRGQLHSQQRPLWYL